MSKTLVALWAVNNTITSKFDSFGFDTRVQHLKSAVTAAAQEVKNGGYDGEMQCILVGPEYLFRSEKMTQAILKFRVEKQKQLDEINQGSREVLDEKYFGMGPKKSFEIQYAGAEAIRLRKALEVLSKTYPRILVVPGTVAFRKEAWQKLPRRSYMTPAQEALGNMMFLRNELAAQLSGQKPHKDFKPSTPVKKRSIDLLDQKISHLKQQVAAYNTIVYDRSGKSFKTFKTQYLAYNTAFVYHNGREVLSYHKQAEISEVDYKMTKNMLYANGRNKTWRHYKSHLVQSNFVIDVNNTYAVEVCLDTGLSRIQSLAKKVDVQIIPAFGQEFAKVGKWYNKLLIFVDGHPHQNYPVVETKAKTVDSYKKVLVGGESLRFYKVSGLGL